ncbi:MAG: hypothetical protein QG657_3018 [Acidobacteriota bacterium]|nr:hypothetical protein [Acidobacteriota bacterium]
MANHRDLFRPDRFAHLAERLVKEIVPPTAQQKLRLLFI